MPAVNEDFALRDVELKLGAGVLTEYKSYFYVKVVKGKHLAGKDAYAYVVAKAGNYAGVTTYLKKQPDPEWNQVFGFSGERIRTSLLEVAVKDLKDDHVIGKVLFELNRIPTRVPPNDPLTPEWYRLEEDHRGELMLAVWWGSQADEVFPEAWLSDASSRTQSKEYISPNLWYVRVNIIEARDLMMTTITTNDESSKSQLLPQLEDDDDDDLLPQLDDDDDDDDESSSNSQLLPQLDDDDLLPQLDDDDESSNSQPLPTPMATITTTDGDDDFIVSNEDDGDEDDDFIVFDEEEEEDDDDESSKSLPQVYVNDESSKFQLPPQVYVKAVLGNQVLSTKISQKQVLSTNNPVWNEELIFVVAEPFHEPLMLSVEDKYAKYVDQDLGKLVIPLKFLQRRLDYNLDVVNSQWYNLDKKQESTASTSGRIHLRLCLEGGYHVLDESRDYISDLRPAAEQLRKPPNYTSIGILEVGIVGAHELIPTSAIDGQGTTDAYCVAKYGHKWVRTRTIAGSISPKWNEQHSWEVFDVCTVITVGVFDNAHLNGIIGKVRIRLSTLEADRVYTLAYPLLDLHISGVRKTGELHLAVRFKSKSSSLIKMMHMYSKPLLPKMHYLDPLAVLEPESLRQQAMQVVSTKLSQADPPLSKEVVEYMLAVDSRMWSMRRSKVYFNRLMAVIGGLIALGKWFEQIRNWSNPFTTLMIHIIFVIFLLYPTLILPAVFFYLFLKGIWNYVLWRPQYPTHIDTRLSLAEDAHPDELDEEFDTFPTSRPSDTVGMRYDRLRSMAGRVQIYIGDVAVQGEKFQSLLSWRDPGATILCITFCLIAAIVVCVIPFRVVAILTVIYVLRHPRFRRQHLPSVPINFFRRLPERTISIL